MQIKIKIKTQNTKQNVNDDRKTHMQIQIEIKVAEPPRIPYMTSQYETSGKIHIYSFKE